MRGNPSSIEGLCCSAPNPTTENLSFLWNVSSGRFNLPEMPTFAFLFYTGKSSLEGCFRPSPDVSPSSKARFLSICRRGFRLFKRKAKAKNLHEVTGARFNSCDPVPQKGKLKTRRFTWGAQERLRPENEKEKQLPFSTLYR